MKITTNRASLIVVAMVAASACSPSGQTSSSSHWVNCTAVSECASVPGAVACEQGYCVGADHARLEATVSPESGSGANAEASANSDAGPAACDPLAPHELPTTLAATLLGAGQDSAGKVYAADSPDGTNVRVFVLVDGTLYRRRVNGTGTSSGPTTTYDISFDDDGTARSLLIDRTSTQVIDMTVGTTSVKGMTDASAPRQPLTLIDDATARAYPVRNLPGDVTIEYVADIDNGNQVVVTHPTDDSGYSDFRLFYGPQGAMVEASALEVLRTRGSDTTITFTLNGQHGTAHFTWILDTADGGLVSHPGPGTLDLGDGKSLVLTQQFPTPTMLTGYAFTCLR